MPALMSLVKNYLIGHLIIIKQPELSPKSSALPHSINKLIPNEPGEICRLINFVVKKYLSTFAVLCH